MSKSRNREIQIGDLVKVTDVDTEISYRYVITDINDGIIQIQSLDEWGKENIIKITGDFWILEEPISNPNIENSNLVSIDFIGSDIKSDINEEGDNITDIENEVKQLLSNAENLSQEQKDLILEEIIREVDELLEIYEKGNISPIRKRYMMADIEQEVDALLADDKTFGTNTEYELLNVIERLEQPEDKFIQQQHQSFLQRQQAQFSQQRRQQERERSPLQRQQERERSPLQRQQERERSPLQRQQERERSPLQRQQEREYVGDRLSERRREEQFREIKERRRRQFRQPPIQYGQIPQCDLPLVDESRFEPTEESFDDYKNYKRICNVVNRQCHRNMSDQDLDMIIRQLKLCHNLRCEFARKYAGGTLDFGHKKILDIIRSKIRYCSNIKRR